MRVQFLLNVLLTIVWVFLTGVFSAYNFWAGFILSYLVLWLISDNEKSKKYFVIVPRILGFVFYFIFQLIKANIQVASDVILPKIRLEPGIIRYPLDAKTDLEITMLANVITLTPGSFSLDISDDRKALYIHAMHIDTKEKFIHGIKNGYEKRILKILR
ncbi:MAG: Na+/H+ antiporter subunit E [Brumimicrobium sp.]